MQKRDILNSPRLHEIKKRRQKIFFRKTLFLSLGLLILFFIFTYISRLNKLNISTVEVIGNKIIDTEMMKSVIQEELTGKYLFLLPKTNLLFYPKNKIQNKLAYDFKRLDNINLSIKNTNTLEVSVVERKAAYVWCGENLIVPTEVLDEENCYFMDDSGYVFDKAPYFSGEVYFKFYGLVHRPTAEGKLSGSEELVDPTGLYFSEADFSRLVSLKEMLQSIAINSAALYKPEDGDLKIYLPSKSAGLIGPEILLKMNSDFQKIVENLHSALAIEPLLSDFKNKYSSLLYIDLRFGNKVYFKFK